MKNVVHTSRIEIRKHQGPHRTALVEGFEDPIHFGVHGGIAAFYKDKYGAAPPSREYLATLDYVIAGVAGWLTGTLARALDVRDIASTENLIAEVEGDIESIDDVLRITRIRIHYQASIPRGSREKAERALATYAEKCPAYQSVKGCIDVTWDADLDEEDS